MQICQYRRRGGLYKPLQTRERPFWKKEKNVLIQRDHGGKAEKRLYWCGGSSSRLPSHHVNMSLKSITTWRETGQSMLTFTTYKNDFDPTERRVAAKFQLKHFQEKMRIYEWKIGWYLRFSPARWAILPSTDTPIPILALTKKLRPHTYRECEQVQTDQAVFPMSRGRWNYKVVWNRDVNATNNVHPGRAKLKTFHGAQN